MIDNYGEMSTQCIPDNLVVKFETKSISDDLIFQFEDKIKIFAAVCSIVMMMFIYFSVNEVEKFMNIYLIRYRNPDTHG
jgi:hypothetical protein